MTTNDRLNDNIAQQHNQMPLTTSATMLSNAWWIKMAPSCNSIHCMANSHCSLTHSQTSHLAICHANQPKWISDPPSANNQPLTDKNTSQKHLFNICNHVSSIALVIQANVTIFPSPQVSNQIDSDPWWVQMGDTVAVFFSLEEKPFNHWSTPIWLIWW